MPLIYVLIASLVSMVPAIVAKIIIATGVGVVSYTGMSLLLGRLTTVILANATAISPDVGVFLNMAGADVMFSMLLSALSMRVALQTTNGVINKVTFSNKSLT